MNGQTIVLSGPWASAKAKALIDHAPLGAVVNIREAARSSEQNAKMWAMLSDIARAKPQGRVLPTEIWKALFMASTGHKMRFEPDLDGEGVVAIGYRSSRLTKAQMSDLIEAMYAYGTAHEVEWSE